MEGIPGCEDVDRYNTEEWIRGDNCDLVNSGEEIADDIEENETGESKKVSHEEGLNALGIALQYIEQQPESNASDLSLIIRWRDIAAKKRMSRLKQARPRVEN
ncbi:hypothetical protein MML48_2g00000361 [Holotrichia oblita]|uniref:Uncharacterized protein n=1 Tax=Holotrichia oblita TaxID=644536 RepID=A0ACB9TJT7_HOLOL|nr:hypothetical protein MML48_2g00000361 [Holotrichia oblita]